jgi:hypothetical protein
VLSFKIKKDFFLIQLKTDNFKLKTRQPLAGAGGGERIRTDDLLRARQALSQLSYTPTDYWFNIDDCRLKKFNIIFSVVKSSISNLLSKLVGLDGVEPSTSRLSGVRSNQTELQAPEKSGSRGKVKGIKGLTPFFNLFLAPFTLCLAGPRPAALDRSKLNSGI